MSESAKTLQEQFIDLLASCNVEHVAGSDDDLLDALQELWVFIGEHRDHIRFNEPKEETHE